MDRRTFLKSTALIAGAGMIGRKPIPAEETSPIIAIVQNGSPEAMAAKVFEMLGGISAFISRDDYVLLKPNISWDRRPEYGATSNPELVAAVVRLCLDAGARKVLIVDNTCNDARRCYKSTRIPEYAEKAGADVRFVRDSHFVDTEIPGATHLDRWLIHAEVFKVDKIINLPILKHHSLSGLTIGFKNMMGLLGGNRGRIHRPFAENIVDINRVIVPHLTIVDAIRVLRRNGPSGGNLNDVDELNTLIAGTDRVLVDAWSARIFGSEPESLEYLKLAHAAGMGRIDTHKFPAQKYIFTT